MEQLILININKNLRYVNVESKTDDSVVAVDILEVICFVVSVKKRIDTMSEVGIGVENKNATNLINQAGSKDRGRKVNSNCKRSKKLKVRRSLSTEKSLLPSKPQDPTDPLNLRSLLDPEINDRLKADTPHVSPIHPRVAKANTILNDSKILVPPQTNDPLMLNREDIEYDKRVRSLKKRKRKLSKEGNDKTAQVNKKSRHDVVADTNKRAKNINQKLFIYGNYNRYYGYRNKTTHDCRLDSWNKEWFDGKDCLDIGCNVGFLTIEVAKKFNPHKIIGIDIDGSLIDKARSNILRANTASNSNFPISFNICHGPIIDTDNDNNQLFPKNIIFKQVNQAMLVNFWADNVLTIY